MLSLRLIRSSALVWFGAILLMFSLSCSIRGRNTIAQSVSTIVSMFFEVLCFLIYDLKSVKLLLCLTLRLIFEYSNASEYSILASYGVLGFWGFGVLGVGGIGPNDCDKL